MKAIIAIGTILGITLFLLGLWSVLKISSECSREEEREFEDWK